MKSFDDRSLYRLLSKNILDEVKEFIDRYGVDSVDRDGRTLLMTAVTERKNEIVRFIVELGGDVNAKDYQGFSALHFAAFRDNDVAAEILLDAGANIGSKDTQGNTPIWRLVMKNGAQSKCYDIFIKGGADINEKNKHGVSPADIMQ